MTNPVIGFEELAAAQAQPEVTVNAGTRALAAAVGGQITIDFASDANYTLAMDSGAPEDDEWNYCVIRMTDTGTELSTARDVIYPDVDSEYGGPSRLLHVFQNDTLETLTLKRSGQTGVEVGAGEASLVRHDGTDIVIVSGGAATGVPYDVGAQLGGAPSSSLVVLRYPFPREVEFPAGLAPSQGYADDAATAQTDFDIQKNGVSIGTMRFAAAGTVASFIFASPVTFDPGDVLEVIAPASPDATLANISFVLSGIRA